jgi:hypothetical protein
MRNLLLAALLATTTAAPALAETPAASSDTSHAMSGSDRAASPAPEPSPHAFDVEVDPFAYIAQGHSLHLGYRYSRLRFDLGSFALTVPEFIHGQPEFELSGHGYGVKFDVYLLDSRSGPFIGAESALFAEEVIELGSQRRAEVWNVSAGLRAGWEFALGSGFYAKPWIEVGHRFGDDEIRIPEGGTFKQPSLQVFPTVHLGYVFP